jgi:hypothetical protein
MSCLDSDKVRHQLKNKLGCEEETGKDHYWYLVRDDAGKLLSKTKVSLGAKHDIGPVLIALMTRQLRLGKASTFVGMVECTKSKADCIEIIKTHCS